MKDLNLAIVIATFQRKDGRSPFYLKRALDSVFSQTYENFKIFLIGDKYENEPEVLSLLENYDKSKIFFTNLPYAKERDRYTGEILWHYGGITAMNEGVKYALDEGYEYVAHLDHDDFWEKNHLEEIVRAIKITNADWVCTKSHFLHGRILPSHNETKLYVDFLPRPCELIHSSVCMNFKKLPLRYRDVFEETGGNGLPADADLWERCYHYFLQNGIKSVNINKITCYHVEERQGI
jgi:glycosyltransferase involved in cell wall biosynthesis